MVMTSSAMRVRLIPGCRVPVDRVQGGKTVICLVARLLAHDQLRRVLRAAKKTSDNINQNQCCDAGKHA